MLKRLITRTAKTEEAPRPEDETNSLDRVKAAYEEWRISQDIGAIMTALDRLSDRRLALIGLRRDDLYDAVTEMMDRVREEKRIAEEVFALLDTASETMERPETAEPQIEPSAEASRVEERAAA